MPLFGYANIFKFLLHVAKCNPNIQRYKAKSGWTHRRVLVLLQVKWEDVEGF